MTRLREVTGLIVEKVSKQLSQNKVSMKCSHWKTVVVAFNEQSILKYKNPDPRCGYPYTPDPLGYCWSYANWVDGNYPFKERTMDQLCQGCELWKGKVSLKYKAGILKSKIKDFFRIKTKK